MLLCRYLLRRVHIPRIVKFTPNIAHFSSNVPDVKPTPIYLNSSLLPKTAMERLSELPVDKVLARLLSRPEPFTSSQSGPTRSPEGDMATDVGPADTYEFLRKKDKTLLSDLPAIVYIHVVKNAFKTRSSVCLDHLATDIVEIVEGDSTKFNRVIQTILALTTDYSLLSRDRVFDLLSHLESLGILSDLPKKVYARVTAVAIAHSDRPLVDYLVQHHINFLQRQPSNILTPRPPQIVEISFLLMYKLASFDRSLALKVFQALVNINCIPAESFCDVDAYPQDFNFIVCSTVIKSCLYWDWQNHALQLLMDMFDSTPCPNEPLADLAVDIIYTLLDQPIAENISHCRHLMHKLHKCRIIPHGLVRRFYNIAHELDLGKDAEALFALTQSPPISDTHQYPLPQGRALTWLLKHLTLYSGNVHLGRVLATRVANDPEPIPLPDRPEFIAITAMHGYGSAARVLWERYATGKDRDVTVANAATMIRMVSLCASIAKRTEAKCREFGDHVSEGMAHPDRERHQNLLIDISDFAERIIQVFRQSKEPLIQAGHHDLTSLSRAYFIVGKAEAGFEIFKILLNRKENPDLHDINVALCLLAEHDPQAAIGVIERMVQRGIRPDSVTFDTVLHHLIVRGDATEISRFLRRARELGHTRLTPKALSSMIRASLQIKDRTRALVRSNLLRVLKIIGSPVNSTFVLSPRIGELGITAALHVNDPKTAYVYWKVLVKGKTEWGDRKQEILRSRIARAVVRQRKAGVLSDARSALMLSDLGCH